MPDYALLTERGYALMAQAGPTGEFPIGGKPQVEGDKGGLAVHLWVLRSDRRLVLDFGTTVSFVASPPAEAKTLAAKLRERVITVWGPMPYGIDDLPIRVETTPTGMIKSIMPSPVELLVANPEVFLAWAQRLDEVADTLI